MAIASGSVVVLSVVVDSSGVDLLRGSGSEFEDRVLLGAVCIKSFESELHMIGALRVDDFCFMLGLLLCLQT